MIILVVDDEPVVREMIRLIFQERGHCVIEAADGVEAVRILDSGLTPSVMLLDMVMPRMDGNAFLAEIRARGVGAPVVVLSAYMHDLRIEHDDMVAAVLAKPPDCTKLIEIVEKLG